MNITSLMWGEFGKVRTSVMPIIDLTLPHCKLYNTFLWLMGSVTLDKVATVIKFQYEESSLDMFIWRYLDNAVPISVKILEPRLD